MDAFKNDSFRVVSPTLFANFFRELSKINNGNKLRRVSREDRVVKRRVTKHSDIKSFPFLTGNPAEGSRLRITWHNYARRSFASAERVETMEEGGGGAAKDTVLCPRRFYDTRNDKHAPSHMYICTYRVGR